MVQPVAIDMRDVAVTPIFKYETLEDVPASEREGKQVLVTHEVVEVRFAGQKLYSPVFPAMAAYRREGLRVITYAERWADQYAAFLNGNEQRAAGTPLEMLKPYGISDAQLSLCRALKIYSIEALAQMEGQAAKNLGMAGNALKEMARQYTDEKSVSGGQAAVIADLQAQIAALRGGIPLADPKPEEIDEAVSAADAEIEALKSQYKDLTGARPRGKPSVETLRSMVAEVQAA